MRRVSQVKIDYWSQHYKAAEVHPGGIGSYCEEQNLSMTMYYKWRKKIALVKSRELKPVFLPVQITEPRISIESKSSSKDRETDLPEARWLAEVLSHLVRSLR